jgi:hypothetical protein
MEQNRAPRAQGLVGLKFFDSDDCPGNIRVPLTNVPANDLAIIDKHDPHQHIGEELREVISIRPLCREYFVLKHFDAEPFRCRFRDGHVEIIHTFKRAF